jgi:hypothetical protein
VLSYERAFEDPLLAEIAHAIASELQAQISAGSLLVEALASGLAVRLVQKHFSASSDQSFPRLTREGLDQRRLFRVLDYVEAMLIACRAELTHCPRSLGAALGGGQASLSHGASLAPRRVALLVSRGMLSRQAREHDGPHRYRANGARQRHQEQGARETRPVITQRSQGTPVQAARSPRPTPIR